MATDDDFDDGLEAFAALARESLALADPPPSDVSELAKLAFQFRDATTIEFDEPALAGVRSDGDITLQATRGTTTVIWSIDDEWLTGVIHADASMPLSLQTADAAIPIEVAGDGSFEVAAPSSPYRIVVGPETERWATPWSMA